jgi:TPR repeat protein
MRNLAHLYECGLGVPKNEAIAAYYRQRAEELEREEHNGTSHHMSFVSLNSTFHTSNDFEKISLPNDTNNNHENTKEKERVQLKNE